MAPSDQSLLTILRQHRFVPAVLLAVMSLPIVNWALRPDRALHWLGAMLFLPGIWLGLTLWHLATLRSRRRRGLDDEAAIARYFGSTMSFVFLAVGLFQIVLFGLQIWVEVADQRIDLDVERRILGLTSSAVFVIVGNALPKILTPLSLLPREQAELVTAARRFAGTVLVILGLAAALAFLTVSLALAMALLRWAMLAGLLTIFGAIVWMNVTAAGRKG
jgi:hypothetical protein